MKRSIRPMVTAMVVVALLLSFTILTSAQQTDARRSIFATAAKDPTSVSGVKIFADRPKGFNPLKASDEELAQYGLPSRPDKTSNPMGYKVWEKGMLSLKYRAQGVKASAMSHGPMRQVAKQTSAATDSVSATPASYLSYNWSGVANTNKLKKWNTNTSFDFVLSVWNVPNAQPPAGACANNILGPFYESTWNGIDGFFGNANGDVIQGGSESAVDCLGDTLYEGWVEWYPSYPELVIYCGGSPCPVFPGDDFEVITYGEPGTNDQFVFEEDLTQGWYGTFDIPWVSGPGVIGGSEEQIVERPCCNADGYPLALPNYGFDFLDDTYGYDGKGTLFYAGSQSASTAIVNMIDDGDTQIISDVAGQGSTGWQGRYSLWFSTENCASSGGCTAF